MKKIFLSLVMVAAFGFATQASAQAVTRTPSTASGVKTQKSERPQSRDMRVAPTAQREASQRQVQNQPAQSAIGKKFGSSSRPSSSTSPRAPQGQATMKR